MEPKPFGRDNGNICVLPCQPICADSDAAASSDNNRITADNAAVQGGNGGCDVLLLPAKVKTCAQRPCGHVLHTLCAYGVYDSSAYGPDVARRTYLSAADMQGHRQAR